jgi:rubrerythrin
MLKDTTPRKAVEFAIFTEQEGREFYIRLAARFADDPELKSICDLLAKDEALHERQFHALLDRLPATKADAISQEEQEYLRALSLSRFFGGDKGSLGAFADTASREDALVHAFETEKATVQFYEALDRLLGGHAVLESIIATERQHMVKLMKYILTDAEFRGISDNY